jgi:hypothetical protein
MRRIIQVVILVLVFLALMVGTLAWPAPGDDGGGPTFTVKDREVINTYYKRLLGNIAPGSVDRSGFSLAIERDLVRGGHLPKYMEPDLQRLPNELSSQLSRIDSGYQRYRIGPHVILLKTSDLTIPDIVKYAGFK